MAKSNLRRCLVALAIAGLAAGAQRLAADGIARVGLETYNLPCAAGDPVTIEVAPSTGRVELKIDSQACLCFVSAEAASHWLETQAQETLSGISFLGVYSGMEMLVAEPPPGGQVDLAAYCFTREMIDSYLQQLTPAQRHDPNQ